MPLPRLCAYRLSSLQPGDIGWAAQMHILCAGVLEEDDLVTLRRLALSVAHVHGQVVHDLVLEGVYHTLRYESMTELSPDRARRLQHAVLELVGVHDADALAHQVAAATGETIAQFDDLVCGVAEVSEWMSEWMGEWMGP